MILVIHQFLRVSLSWVGAHLYFFLIGGGEGGGVLWSLGVRGGGGLVIIRGEG